ncbi:acyl-CoA dehydrogenase family protein [Segniliparus rugosus]|nr:acyl-CoA dehydrogenase family protein [Segniliparus rugosus]
MSSVVLSSAPTDAELQSRFRPVFAHIAEGAIRRERERRLPFDEIQLLRESGFTRLRVPQEFGGLGASLPQVFRLLIDLAEAESNLPQALRVHFGFLENLRLEQDPQRREQWLRRAGEGAIFGNAITELGQGFHDRYRTTLAQDGQGWRLDGEKFYSTGSLFADHILVAAQRGDDRVSVLVDADQPGVSQQDDWDGFGQRLTASGTSRYEGVQILGDRVFEGGYGDPGKTHQTALFQLVQLSVLAGIAKRAVADVVEVTLGRTRTFNHALADLPKDDPLVQQVIGRGEAAAFAARATVLAVADLLGELLDLLNAGEDAPPELYDEAELAAAKAQSAVIPLVLRSVTDLFEVGGASITRADKALDRHWRNARTISLHNPVIYKEQRLGDNLLNGAAPPYAWTVGERNPTK